VPLCGVATTGGSGISVRLEEDVVGDIWAVRKAILLSHDLSTVPAIVSSS